MSLDVKTKIRVKKSMKLTPADKSGLEKFVKMHDTYIDAAEALSITYQSLSMIRVRGTARPCTVERIRAAIKGL